MAAKPDPKISTSEAVLVGMFLLGLDAIDLIPFAGDLTDVAAAPLLLYYHMKHINGVMYGVGLILDLIPATQEFPTRSIVWWGTVAFDRFAPAKVEEAVEKLGEVEEGGEGGPGGVEGEGGLGTGAAEETQQGATSAEQAGEGTTAEANVESDQAGERGGAGESSDEGGGGSRVEREGGEAGQGEGGAEGEAGGGEGEEGGGENREEEDPMRRDAEITPEEEAAEASFGPTETGDDTPQAEEEQDEEAPPHDIDPQVDGPGSNVDQPNSGGAGSRDGGGQRMRHSTRRRR